MGTDDIPKMAIYSTLHVPGTALHVLTSTNTFVLYNIPLKGLSVIPSLQMMKLVHREKNLLLLSQGHKAAH